MEGIYGDVSGLEESRVEFEKSFGLFDARKRSGWVDAADGRWEQQQQPVEVAAGIYFWLAAFEGRGVMMM